MTRTPVNGLTAILVGSPSLRKFAADLGVEVLCTYDLPEKNHQLAPIARLVGEVDVLVTDSMRWWLCMPKTLFNALDPGKLRYVYFEDRPVDMGFFTRAVGEARDQHVRFQRRLINANRTKYARKTTGYRECAERIVEKYIAVAEHFKDFPSMTDTKRAAEFKLSIATIARIRKAIKELSTRPWQPLVE